MSERRFSLHVPLAWQYVREVRRTVEHALAASDGVVREAATMAASELVENAIKYGESVAAAPDVGFALTVSDERVTIDVTNGVSSAAGFAELRTTIGDIARARDCEPLYLSRLERLLSEPAQRGKLGLYRVGLEGGFDLSYAYSQQVLTVTATRGKA